jgi:hypothetical protein
MIIYLSDLLESALEIKIVGNPVVRPDEKFNSVDSSSSAFRKSFTGQCPRQTFAFLLGRYNYRQQLRAWHAELTDSSGIRYCLKRVPDAAHGKHFARQQEHKTQTAAQKHRLIKYVYIRRKGDKSCYLAAFFCYKSEAEWACGNRLIQGRHEIQPQRADKPGLYAGYMQFGNSTRMLRQ